MKYKILLFLITLLMTTMIVSATENTTSITTTCDDNVDTANTIKEINKPTEHNDNIKKTPASNIHLDDAIGECYYGGRITYTMTSEDENRVDEGKITLYVNNTQIAIKDVDDEENIDWIYDYQYNQILDNYPAGSYPMKITYSNEASSITSNNATLTINTGYARLLVNGDVGVAGDKISIPVTVLADATGINIDHGKITSSYNNKNITTVDVDENEVHTILLPSNYQQKTVKLTYTDTRNMLKSTSEDVFLDVNIASTGKINTTITVNDARIINKTHLQDNQTIYDAIAIQVDTRVNTLDDMLTVGHLTAYHNNNKIASSNNTTSIIIPAKYNLEEINLTYTGEDDYNDSSIQFTLMADKITTRTYSSYISATKNSNVNIYPRITSNTPYLYGKINIYIDNNLIKTIDIQKDNIYISTNTTSTTIGDTLDLSGYEEGVYNLTFEADENNVFTGSSYTTTLTISKVNTYIYASNRTIYVGDTSILYAYVYANNKDVVNTGQMSFTIDGQLIGTEYVTNNTASMEYTVPSTLTLGKHTLVVTYEGSDNYNTSTKEATLTLSKTATTTTLRTWTVTDEKIILNVQTRAYNKTINTGNITAYIDNKQVTTSQVTNNTANITLPDNITTDTTYNLRLVYSGSDLLNSSSYESTHFIFNRKNTTVRVYPYLRSNGTITLTGYVYSDNYARVDAGEIIFSLNNQIIARANVENNKANTTYDMASYDAANYTLKATYNGSKLFNTSINSTTVTKTPYYHTIYMNIANKSLSVKRGSSTSINATLTCYSRNITEDINATISLNATWGTVVYTQDVTFHNGVLNTKLSIPKDFELFKFEGREITRYTLTINTLQSQNFKETSQSATLNIGEYTKLYQKTLWGYKNANVTFNSTLQDADGKQVPSNTTAKIDIYTLKDNKYKLMTSFNASIINGKLEYTYNLPADLTDNTYTINITVCSNDDIAGCYKTVNMTLNNRRSYITASNIQSYIDSNIILNGTIMDSITRSKANTNTQVDILIDNKKIATVNTTRGTFKYTIKNNYTKGQHNLSYSYHGDNIYNTSNRSVNFTSNKNTIRIKATPISAKIGDLINIKANITNTNASLVKDTLKADIILNNKTIASNITITNGMLSYNYTIAKGTQSNSKITINIHESSKYNQRNATITLKINKDYHFISLEKTTITTSKQSKITINGNITDKNKNPITGSRLNIKVAGETIANITSNDGKFSYEYTTTQNNGTYDILVTVQETDNYMYNAKHICLKVT